MPNITVKRDGEKPPAPYLYVGAYRSNVWRFIKFLNRRWSLYVVKDNNSAYAMHANSRGKSRVRVHFPEA